MTERRKGFRIEEREPLSDDDVKHWTVYDWETGNTLFYRIDAANEEEAIAKVCKLLKIENR